MTRLPAFKPEAPRTEREDATIVGALDMWSSWHAESSPLGATGDYALDMLLADAFRHLLYRPALKDRLDWIEREIRRPRRRPLDDLYHAELIAWWLDLWDAGKLPNILAGIEKRRLRCVSL
jgi:hypothetical protein